MLWLVLIAANEAQGALRNQLLQAHHLALHCFADLRTSKEEIRAHWLSPYFITAAFRISSCIQNGGHSDGVEEAGGLQRQTQKTQ